MDLKQQKQKLLTELHASYKKCTKCPLSSQGRQNVVLGEGNINAKIMFIGEGPGKDEDILGKPFIGRSGKLLDKILKTINIKRKDVFITNVVKCRPPKNRKPLSIESKTCKQLLLLKQIKIIKPQIICTLGASALEALINKPVKITQIRGKILLHENLIILPTYHPAYILRNNKNLKKFTDDLEKAKNFT